MTDSYVSIVIPALNEELNMRPLLKSIQKVLAGYRYDVLVVDGGSTDRTVEISRQWGARILFDGDGKGSALRAGLRAAQGEILIAMDADLSQHPRELPLFIHGIEAGYDICMGSRFMPGGKSYDITLLRALGNRMFCWFVNVRFKASYTDLCYGYRSFRSAVFDGLGLKEAGFGIEAELSIAASKLKLRVLEVPSIEKKRKFGDPKLHTLKDGFAVLKAILKNSF